VPIAREVVKDDKHVCARGNSHDKPLADSEEAARELVEAAGVVNQRFCPD
jgi:hypothetical protein